MLKGTDDRHAWMKASPEDRKQLCKELAQRLGRNEEFLFRALDHLFEGNDPRMLDNNIEEVAKVSVAAVQIRPQD